MERNSIWRIIKWRWNAIKLCERARRSCILRCLRVEYPFDKKGKALSVICLFVCFALRIGWQAVPFLESIKTSLKKKKYWTNQMNEMKKCMKWMHYQQWNNPLLRSTTCLNSGNTQHIWPASFSLWKKKSHLSFNRAEVPSQNVNSIHWLLKRLKEKVSPKTPADIHQEALIVSSAASKCRICNCEYQMAHCNSWS